MKSPNKNLLPESTIARGVFLGLFALVFVLISAWRWRLISSSMISLLLTPVALLFTDVESSRYLRSELWEYWIAAGVWLLIVILLITRFLRVLFAKKRPVLSQPSPSVFLWVSGPGRVGRLVLALFVYVALSAPFLAPFHPTSQGDLTSTRLLRPMANGLVFEKVTSERGLEPRSDNSVERLLDRVNSVLLDREEKFIRWEESRRVVGGVDSYQIRTFFLGTDDLGRDVLSRVIYGTRISLGIGFAAMCCTVLVGCLIGFLAGGLGGWIDRVLMRITDLFLAIPSLFLVIALLAFFGNSTLLLIAVLAATGWMNVARLIRGEVLVLREREFILSARLLGRSSIEILRDHMVPNVLPTILVASVLQLGNVILAEAALSFLGLGIQPPTPSWGNMIGESMAYIDSAWWVGVFPGLALSTLVVTAHFLAERAERESHAFA